LDSGSINPADWAVNDVGAVTRVINAVDGVAGDDALMITGNTLWGQTISSLASYSRAGSGLGIFVEFSTWVENHIDCQQNQPACAGAPNQGFHGPFHQVDHPMPSPDAAAPIGPFSIELGAEWNWFPMRWSENAQWDPDGPPLSGANGTIGATWQSRFGHSLGKSEALRVRFTLGATQGGMIEWFNTDFDEDTQDVVGWVLEGDFREGVLAIGSQGSGTAASVRLGFECWLGNANTAVDTTTGIVRNGVFIDDILVAAIEPEPEGGQLAGDCNQDGEFDLSDVICVLGHLFQGNPEELPCSTTVANLALMDCNGDGAIDLSDAVYKLGFLFSGGPPPERGTGCTVITNCPTNPGCP
jgi:hypothetical protein